MIPLALWFVIIPLIVKVKFFANPLAEYPWYSSEASLADFFLYYKSQMVTIVGVIMLAVLIWLISGMRNKETLFNADTRVFIPILVYFVLAVFSSLFSEYGYFCTHGMPDQFETIWNLIAYAVAMVYCYYVIVYQDAEKSLLSLIVIGAALVSIICVLQYFKLDIYRLIYAGDGYSFTFEEGTVYGPFYNTNYVGYYTLLFAPLFVLLLIFYKDLKVRIISAVLTVALLISMFGAKSSTAVLAFVMIAGFAIVFIVLKNIPNRKIQWALIAAIIAVGIVGCVLIAPRAGAYIKAQNTEKRNLENIFTHDENVEIDYLGNQLYVQMIQTGENLFFTFRDQDQSEVSWENSSSDQGYYYTITDERFAGMTVMPVLITEDPEKYGFMVGIDGKNWCFTNQMTDDGTYYYYNDLGKLTKLTSDNVSADFKPLVDMSLFASGRGYIWCKTIPLLKDYVLFGSGADTYALVYPNDDFVDKFNNGYDNMILTKPHNMYLQIAVQTGVLSLICFLIFYLWYFISSLRIYFKQKLDTPLAITGFAIVLGTLGYMISGLANDSTITITPLFWALIGMGIGINHRIKSAAKQKK